MSSSVLVIGSVALDSVQTPFGKEMDGLGGSASFFSAAARFFCDVSMVGVVGYDFPVKHQNLFKRIGINTDGLQRVPGKTFRWKGFYDYDLNTAKTLSTELNVFQSFKPQLNAYHKKIKNVFLANIDPNLQLSVINQCVNKQLSACDTMNYWIESQKKAVEKVLSKVDIFLCNDAEARSFSGEYNLLKAARWVFSKGPKIFVIKKGEHGVICMTKDFSFSLPGFLLESIYDPTGAGDSFAGGFFGYLSSQARVTPSNIRKAIIYGSVLASYNVESFSLYKLANLKKTDIVRRENLFKKLTQY